MFTHFGGLPTSGKAPRLAVPRTNKVKTEMTLIKGKKRGAQEPDGQPDRSPEIHGGFISFPPRRR